MAGTRIDPELSNANSAKHKVDLKVKMRRPPVDHLQIVYNKNGFTELAGEDT